MARVLIVDDDEAVLEVTAAILKRCGHQVFTAENAEAAVALLKESEVDLIVLDVVLPGQGGIELLMDIRKESREIPVIIMSGKVRTELLPFKSLAQQFGAACILTKPFTSSELLEAVDAALKASCA